MSIDKLKELRGQVKALDLKLLSLLNERASACLEIGKLKTAGRMALRDPVQERRVLTYLLDENPGPLREIQVETIFEAVMTSCRRLQEDASLNSRALEEGRLQANLPSSLYCVLGNPVAQSMSPLMHTMAFQHIHMDAAYVPYEVDDLAGALAGLKNLGCKGASVTHPFKEDIISHIDEVDDFARRIGAVNTLVISPDGVTGKNTDWIGLVRTIEALMPVEGNTFAVLGAGGAARAAVFGITKGGGNVVVVNRSKERGRSLASDLGASFASPFELETVKADCLVNTTPVGMYPHTDETPVPLKLLTGYKAVVDIIYNPLETKLVQQARSRGCKTAAGLEMFVQQGAEQFRIWTGTEAPVELMRQVVHRQLAAQSALTGAVGSSTKR